MSRCNNAARLSEGDSKLVGKSIRHASKNKERNVRGRVSATFGVCVRSTQVRALYVVLEVANAMLGVRVRGVSGE